MREEIRKLIANRVSYLITQEKQTPQFAVFCAIHDVLLEIWTVCHNDIYPSDVSSDLYDQLHDQACSWADECLKEVQYA